MFDRTMNTFKKIKKNGLAWTFHRMILEFRIPDTPLGKKILHFNHSIYAVCGTLKCLVLKIFKKK